MTELLLVRHGRPESAGYTDPPLNEEGQSQAHALARLLVHEEISSIVSSGLRRARQTAAILGEAVGRTPYALEGLNEWGVPADSLEYVALEVLGADTPQVRAFREGRFMDFVPDLVDVGAFRRKVVGAFDEILAAHPEGRVVVVCHGGTINAYVGQLVGIPDIFWFHPQYTSVSRMDRRPGGRVVVTSLNEVHHLAKTPPHDSAAMHGQQLTTQLQ